MPTPTPVDRSAPALGVIFTPDDDITQYEVNSRRVGVAETQPAGMLIHWAAETRYGVSTGSLWRRRDLGEKFVASVLADAITASAGELNKAGGLTHDVSYQLWPIETFTTGPAAKVAAGRDIGEAAGAIVCTPKFAASDAAYRGAVEKLDLETKMPEAMIMHAVAQVEDGRRWVDVWLDEESTVGYYEAAGAAVGEVERVQLHTLVINLEELAEVPRFKRM
jgi:hypothetical protein